MSKAKKISLRKFHPTAVAMTNEDSRNLKEALLSASAPGPAVSTASPGAATPASGAFGAGIGDTPPGITIDYEGPVDGDMPVGALADSQVVALIKNTLLQPAVPFFYRFHNQIFVRIARAN